MTYLFFFLIIVSALGGYFLFKNFLSPKKIISAQIISAPAVPASYETAGKLVGKAVNKTADKVQVKQSEEAEVPLTLQQKIDLSWEFLANITKLVIQRFSEEEQATLRELREQLLASGMKYEHDVEMELIFRQHFKKMNGSKQNRGNAAVVNK